MEKVLAQEWAASHFALDTVIDSFPENMAFDAADSMTSSSLTALAPANANAAGNPLPLPASSRRVRGGQIRAGG